MTHKPTTAEVEAAAKAKQILPCICSKNPDADGHTVHCPGNFRKAVARELTTAASVRSAAVTEELFTSIDGVVGGSYEMPDGRKFWIDGPVAREIAGRVCNLLSTKSLPAVTEEEIARIIDNEPEAPGSMPSALNLCFVEDVIRAAIRATKRSIKINILDLLSTKSLPAVTRPLHIDIRETIARNLKGNFTADDCGAAADAVGALFDRYLSKSLPAVTEEIKQFQEIVETCNALHIEKDYVCWTVKNRSGGYLPLKIKHLRAVLDLLNSNSLPSAPTGWKQKISTILDECENDFLVCERCGFQDDEATKTSNLFLILKDMLAAAPSPAPTPLAVVKPDLRSELNQITGRVDALELGPSAPTGWKLVPVEPTMDMLGALWHTRDRETQNKVLSAGAVYRRAYDAMLAASPKPYRIREALAATPSPPATGQREIPPEGGWPEHLRKWILYWHGSGPERGTHVMRMGRYDESSSTYDGEIAYLGSGIEWPAAAQPDGLHDQAQKIVTQHNAAIDLLRAAQLSPPSPATGEHVELVKALRETTAEAKEHLKNIIEASALDPNRDHPEYQAEYQKETARMEALIARADKALSAPAIQSVTANQPAKGGRP